MARTFQHIDLVDELSVIDNIAIGTFRPEGATLRAALIDAWPRPAPEGGTRPRRRARCLARRVRGRRFAVRELPYGTRRRVEVARALEALPGCCCSTSRPPV